MTLALLGVLAVVGVVAYSTCIRCRWCLRPRVGFQDYCRRHIPRGF